MAKQIAIAGKGGTGKTTFTSLLTRYILAEKKGKSVLAVDADANANLNEALGLDLEMTMSDILENTKDPKQIPAGMSKQVYVEFKLSEALAESEQIDLLVMGNPQKAGCYCYPNDLLKKYLEKLRKNYDYVLVDNEAGLEHLSRKIVDDLDYLVVTSDASARGVRSAKRVHDIVKSVGIKVEKMFLVISRGQEDTVEALQEEIDKTGLEFMGIIPLDSMLANYDLEGKPLIDLPDDSVAVQAVTALAKKLGI